MSDAAGVLWLAAITAAAFFLSRRWPHPMRRVSRCLAVANGLALLCIIATGWLPRTAPVVVTHRWLPHGLFILDWTAIPLAIGVTLGRSRVRPIAAAMRASGLLILLGVVLVASITGYLGPSSQGPRDAMTLRRFETLHYCVLPALAVALVVWWYYSLAPAKRPTPSANPEV